MNSTPPLSQCSAAAAKAEARVWVVNEYTHVDVDTPIYLNRELRKAGLLEARRGPFGEQLEPYASDSFAVCDHQVAHVYVANEAALRKTQELLAGIPGIDRVYLGAERGEIGLDHPRAGDLVALSKPNAWFAYPF